MYEFLATLVDRLIWLKAEQNFHPKTAELIGSFGVGIITVVGKGPITTLYNIYVNLMLGREFESCLSFEGMEKTGMYFNPILATSVTFGCQGQGRSQEGGPWRLGRSPN